jgi:hypothetical protein
MAVPFTFGSATAAIPLSQLDTNFATTITLGNTAIQLGNTVTTLNNMTLGNVTVSSGNVTVSAGSNTSPSITTVGDTNTGLFFPAADTIAFAEGGAEVARFDSDGDFGLGTTSPSSKLQVLGPVGSLNDGAGSVRIETDAAGTDVLNALGAGVVFAQRWQGVSGPVRVGGVYGVKGASSSNFGGALAFYTQPVSGADMAERARFNATGALVFAGGTTTADGIGITFPATQSASSNANTLDDYEEGTWTPTLGGTTTYLKQLGRYTKIGNKVFIEGVLEVNAINSPTYTGDLIGLPFTTNAAEPQGTISVGYWAASANAYAYVSATLGQAGTGINLRGNVGAAFGLGALTFFTNGTAIYFTGQYSV